MAKKRRASPTERSLPFKVAGRYDVQELLGVGGMATVYKAWDETLEAHVTLKLLTIEKDRQRAARAVELFEREFHTLVHLSHPRSCERSTTLSMPSGLTALSSCSMAAICAS